MCRIMEDKYMNKTVPILKKIIIKRGKYREHRDRSFWNKNLGK